MNIFDFHEWQAPIITSYEMLCEQIKNLNLSGKCIREIWNIGIIFNEDAYEEDEIMFAEIDEPIIFVFDEFNLEILFSDGSTVRISCDNLSLNQTSYQGVECSRRAEKYLSAVLNMPISEVRINTSDECEFTGAYGLELPEQDKYIEEIVMRFDSGYSLHIIAWYDYMHLYITDKDGKIPNIEVENEL